MPRSEAERDIVAVPDKPMVPPAQYRLHPDGERSVHDAGGDQDDDVDLDVRYPFVFDRLLAPLAFAVGVTPRTAWVSLTGDGLRVRFGPWSLATTLDNVARSELTGPYRPLKVAGPPHLSFRDRGVTFATNRRQGACIAFREPVAGLLPLGIRLHPGATVTVGNPDDLVRRLTAHIGA